MSSAGISFTGLATGLDTNTIVKQLMTIERRPVTSLQSKKATTNTVIDRLRALNTKLSALENSAKSLIGASLSTSAFTAKKATSSDEKIFTAKVTNNTTAINGTFTMDVIRLARAQSRGGGAFNAGHAGGTLTISGAAGTANISVSAGETVDSIAAKINADTASGMNATVVNGRLRLVGKNTGAAENYTFSTSGGMSLGDLGLATGNVTAQDARIRVAGVTVNSATNTFTNAMSGVDVTAVAVGSGQTLKIENDSTAVVDKMKDLVAKFNEIVAQVKEDTKYDPTTRKAGPLTGDPLARSIVTEMTKMVTDPVNPSGATGFQNYNDIGISVQRDGTLSFDENKFKTQLAANPTELYKLLGNEDGAMNGSTKLNQAGTASTYGDGIANRLAAFANQLTSSSSLYNDVNPSGGRYKGNLALRLEFQEARIKSYDTQIASYEVRLTKREEFLKKQFLAMETTVSQLRSQGNYLSGQFASAG